MSALPFVIGGAVSLVAVGIAHAAVWRALNAAEEAHKAAKAEMAAFEEKLDKAMAVAFEGRVR